MRKPRVAIGIDLGTSKCCVGVVRDGKVEILENERGSKTTPSYVAFTDTERLIGEDAKDQATLNPANTVFGVKRLLGRKFEDPAVKTLVPRLPYKLHSTELGKPILELRYMRQRRQLYPEQVTAMLLTKMLDLVRKQFDCSVEEAVISVPASFSNAQRQATKDAAAIAGLRVLALINEPTAAAIAYEANRKEEEDEIIAVVDFGGGKIEVSFVRIGKGSVEVTAVCGCNRIGGLDVDNCLVELLISKFKLDRDNVKAKVRLHHACEKLKHTLSLLPEARVQLDCLFGDIDFETTVTRSEYDKVLEDNIVTSMNRLEHRMERLTVAKVLLVGGSTRIPLVQEWLKKTFDTIKLDKTINPDEAVAQGAAIWAAMLSRHCEVPEVDVRDIIPNTVRLDIDNTSEILFDRFTTLPSTIVVPLSAQSSKSVFTLWECQSSLHGVRKLALGDYPLRNKSLYSIKIEGQIDRSGILVASVYLNGKKESLLDVIRDTLRLFDDKQLCELINQEEEFRKNAIDENKRVMALSELEAFCFQLKNSLKTLGIQGELSQNQLRDLEEQIDAAITWVDNNPGASEGELDQQMLDLLRVHSSFSRNSKERSSRSSSVGHTLVPASSRSGIRQERVSRRDQFTAVQDAPKARVVSQSARRSRHGLSQGMPAVVESRSSRTHSQESPQRLRSAENQSANNMYSQVQSPQTSRGDSHHRQTPEQSRIQSPRKQTFEITQSKKGPPSRQPSPYSRGQSPQRRSGGSVAMQPEIHNPHQLGGTALHQPNDQVRLSTLSSTIIKGFTKNQSNQRESNLQPRLKLPLLPTEGKLATGSRGLSSRNQSGADNKHPVQCVDAKASSKPPASASGSRSQPDDQDWAISQPTPLPYQVVPASVSQPSS